jgi:hypothetical protein
MAYGQQIQGFPPVQGYGSQPQGPGQQPDYGGQGYGGAQQGNPHPFQQGYAQYIPYSQSYTQGYESYYGTPPKQRDPSAFLNAVRQIPALFRNSFQDPGAALQGMMERRDFYTAPVIAGAALLLAFLCGMLSANGMVGLLFAVYSSLTGANLAGSAAGLSQGVSLIAGRIGPSFGVVVAVCQLFASFTITTLPTVAASLLAMSGMLSHPSLLPLLSVFGMVPSFLFMGSLMGRVTGRPEGALVIPRILCICLSILLTMLFVFLVGGAMMGSVTKIITDTLRGIA